jgi:hypothetical protein
VDRANDRNPQRYPSKLSLGQHCRNLAGYYGLAEQKALELAGVHKQMAQQLEVSQGTDSELKEKGGPGWAEPLSLATRLSRAFVGHF